MTVSYNISNNYGYSRDQYYHQQPHIIVRKESIDGLTCPYREFPFDFFSIFSHFHFYRIFNDKKAIKILTLDFLPINLSLFVQARDQQILHQVNHH